MNRASVSSNNSSQTTIDTKRLVHAAALLMAANQRWNSPGHEKLLGEALQASREIWKDIQLVLSDDKAEVPMEIRNNLLIVSVYAESKLEEIAQSPDQEKMASLIDLTRSLAMSLREWHSAA
jgi:flagellar biosynthesis regulator FlaF